MIRTILLAMSLLVTAPAHAQDNNPFSGATGISVEMTRDIDQPINISKSAAEIRHLARGRNPGRASFRLRCTLDGRPINWKERARHYRLRLAAESIDVPPDAAGPMMVLLWAGGARCDNPIRPNRRP